MENNYHILAMNIKHLKEELERLSIIINGWDEDKDVDALEQDMALDRLKNLYSEIRFSSSSAKDEVAEPKAFTAPIPVAEEPMEEPEEEETEQEVEVEFIFDEEDVEYPQEDEEQPLDGQATESTEEEAIDNEVDDDNFFGDDATPAQEDEPSEEQTPEPAQEEEPAPESIQEPVDEEVTQHEAPVVMGNLFGDAEPARKAPRTKHQRMMSIYSDTEESAPQEKSVDISKIFELDDIEVESAEPAPEPQSVVIEINEEEDKTPAAEPLIKANINEERTTILADVISPAAPTIADSIAAPTALADEIEHSAIRSLSDGIGINDKFLMIRDLFDGNSAEYERVIKELDTMESFDDCMIYIVENYSWNPDSDGAKFIMKLLERKLS